MKLLQITLLIILLTTINMQAEILNVPDDFETIQGAIDDAEAGDTVLVQPGTYEENLTIPDREMTIASLILTTGDQAYTDSTVIEGAEDGQSVITFDDVGEDVVLTGFTITGGGGRFGAGINCIGSSPTLTFLNLTENNSTWRGGGIYCGDDSNPVIDMLWITNNFARFGGGIGIERSQPVISRMLVADNTSDAEGGGLYLNQGSLDIVNSTFVNNQCDIASNLYFLGQTLTLTNCIFWNNPGPDVLALMGQTNIDHCDIQDGRDGVDARGRLNYGNNNISEDPEFINADEGDYHLTEDSPCIDTGDPDSPEDPDETRADMGAFYFNQRHESETLLVPQDYETIQAAIDASQDGDTVLVSPGVYVENINFEGKGITVASLILTTGDAAYIDSTIIDGNEEDCVVSFASEEDSSAVLQGFTIRNGIQDFGGGIDCQMNSGPTLMDLVITENEANSMGGGIYCAHNSNPDIIRVEIVDNVAQIGGGICLNGSHSEMREVMITQNTRGGLVAFGSRNHFTLEYSTIYNNSGVGIAIPSIGHDRGILLRNITVYGNDAGISIDTHEGQRDEINLINSIVCDNNEYELRIFASDEPTTLNVSFSDIDGGEDGVEIEENGELEWGDGNIDEDPQFVDSDNGDYHLTEDSPCIDTGDPDSPEDPDETRADMGAFYFHQFGRFIDVPDDFETIQAAVDAADAGDTVLVHPGTYVENVFVWYEDITIGSLYMTTGEEHFIEETIVDGDSIYAVFDLGWCESPPRDQGPVVLSGLTIRNGRKGIYCRGAYLRIENCIIRDNHGGETGGGIFLTHETDLTVINSRITNNTAVNGAGIYCHDPAPVITGCTFNGNFAEEAGGAIYLTAGAEPQIEDCIITGNFADIGGGIYCEASNPVITSCLFTGNMCENFLGWTFAATENSTPVLINCTISWAAIFGWTPAVFCSASDMIIANSLIWGDSPLSISFDSESAASSMTIAFSDIYGGPNSIDTNDNGEVNWLDGSIAEDPRYVDYWGGDYNLTENSPCVDAGTAFFVWEDDTLVNMTEDEYQSGAPDMGAYESEYSGINANIKRIPTEFTLHQNYPNPFNSTTSLSFDLPVSGNVTLVIYDISGREIAVIEDDTFKAGRYNCVWDAQNLPSGIYIARLESGDVSRTVKLMLIR